MTGKLQIVHMIVHWLFVSFRLGKFQDLTDQENYCSLYAYLEWGHRGILMMPSGWKTTLGTVMRSHRSHSKPIGLNMFKRWTPFKLGNIARAIAQTRTHCETGLHSGKLATPAPVQRPIVDQFLLFDPPSMHEFDREHVRNQHCETFNF